MKVLRSATRNLRVAGELFSFFGSRRWWIAEATGRITISIWTECGVPPNPCRTGSAPSRRLEPLAWSWIGGGSQGNRNG